jgi:hypothetical protein
MHKISIFIFILCVVSAISTGTLAGDFDGSRPLLGRIDRLIEINADRIIDGMDPEQAGLPPAFVIDFKKKTIQPTRDSLVRRIIRIERVARVENKLMLQGTDENVEGVEDGLGWTMAISIATGEFVLTASGDGTAYTVFGKLELPEAGDVAQ